MTLLQRAISSSLNRNKLDEQLADYKLSQTAGSKGRFAHYVLKKLHQAPKSWY